MDCFASLAMTVGNDDMSNIVLDIDNLVVGLGKDSRGTRIIDERVVGFIRLMFCRATRGEDRVMQKPSLRRILIFPRRQGVQCLFHHEPYDTHANVNPS